MKQRRLENLCAVLMIAVTFYISSKCDLISENWTALLLKPEKKLLIPLGTLGSILFCFLLYQFSKRTKKPQKVLSILTMICMPLSLIFVFEPLHHPLQSSLHLFFAYAYFFMVNLTFIVSLVHLYFKEFIKSQKIIKIYTMILCVSSLMFMHFMSINTLFELFFTCSMTLLLTYSLHLLR